MSQRFETLNQHFGLVIQKFDLVPIFSSKKVKFLTQILTDKVKTKLVYSKLKLCNLQKRIAAMP